MIPRRGAVALAATLALVAVGTLAASSSPPGSRVTRTPWGDPDLQGVWSGVEVIGVPLERDPQLGTRNVLTDDEFHDRRARLLAGASPDNIEATNFGAEPEIAQTRSHQASLIVIPADGRLPPRVDGAKSPGPGRTSFSPGPFESVADFGLFDRCIAFSTIPVATAVNTVHIVQSPGYVAIVTEGIHDTRIVWLDGRPTVTRALNSYMGDSRGRWDGESLIVTTSNLNGRTNLLGNVGPTSDRATLIERYTLVTHDALSYEATIDDPGTWTRPWTLSLPRKRDANSAVLESACHEGNYGLSNILRAARAQERPAP